MTAQVIKGTAHVQGSNRSFNLFNGKEISSVKQDGVVFYRVQGLDKLLVLEEGTVVKTYDGFKESVMKLVNSKWEVLPPKFDPSTHQAEGVLPAHIKFGDVFSGHSINGDKCSQFPSAVVVGAMTHCNKEGEVSSVSARVTVERDGAMVERSIVPERFTGTVTRAGKVVGRYFLGQWEPTMTTTGRRR